MGKRESFKSSLGFILVSAGCAIGIGNVWKFPYVAGENGGGIFVLFYLFFLAVMGIPILTMELSVGRASRQGAVGAYKTLEKPGQKWHIHGWFAIGGNYLLMMYYTTVSGWMLSYCYKFITGTFSGIDPASADATNAVKGVFSDMLGNPTEMIIFMAIIVIAGFLICSFSLQGGLERISKFMMLGLLGLIIILAVNSALLPGASEGLAFFLLPNFEIFTSVGSVAKVLAAAMTQAFFTLSLGIASMEIFGSYMSKNNSITGEATRICVLDTFVAVMSGLIIFPACSAFGIEYDAGPSLIFNTLPRVFINMENGRLWGTLFFVFMVFASFSTVIAVFQNLMAACQENFGWSKIKTSIINCIFMLIASIPCVLGNNVWSNIKLAGMDILGMEDFVVSQLLLPIGTIVYLLFCVSRFGWGFDNYLEECNTGKGLKMPRWTKNYFRYVLPILIVVVLVWGLIGVFFPELI